MRTRVTPSTTSHMKTAILPSQHRKPMERQHECSHSLKTQNRGIRRSTLKQESIRHTRTANGASRGKADCERVKRRGLSATYSHSRSSNSRGRGSSPRTSHLVKTPRLSPNDTGESFKNHSFSVRYVGVNLCGRTHLVSSCSS